MGNWIGTLTNNNPTGISTGFNSSTSFNDNLASWPTLTDWSVRITGGLGQGQTRKIQINTATQIVITEAWDTIPDATSTYEIIFVLRNNDHITGNLTLSTGIITELEDSANIYIDGLYYIAFINNCQTRWNKTKSTIVKFLPNNLITQGKAGFWNYLYFQATLTGYVKASYLSLIDSAYGILAYGSVGLALPDSSIHHIKTEGLINNFFGRGGTDSADVNISYLLNKNSSGGSKLSYNTTANSAYTEKYSRVWSENCATGGITFGSSTCNKIQIIKDSVFKKSYTDSLTNPRADANKRVYLMDNYFSTLGLNAYMACGANVDTNGITRVSRNVSMMGHEIFNNYAHAMAIYSKYNDFASMDSRNHYAIQVTAATTVESDSDFIAGRLLADPLNVDTTEAINSTANPQQYLGLTSARTRAKTTRNKLLEIDNIIEGTPTDKTCILTFDCKNSHTGTAVNADSNSGQKILYVASTTDFEELETIEIGYGTDRQEFGEIESIQAGTSITLKANLTYTHTLAQADTVKKQLRNFGLPFVKYGVATGNYQNETPIPPENKWGEVFTEFETNFYGKEFEWKKVGHTVELTDLRPSTTYYYKCFAYTPLGELIESAEGTFTTAADTAYTDPLEDNVRAGTNYKFADTNKTGVMNLPSTNDVRDGITYDNGTKTGLLNLPAIADVRFGITYDQATKTGLLNIPIVNDVRYNITYDNGTKTGLLDLPLEAVVLLNIKYDNNTKTGTYTGSGGATKEEIYDYFTTDDRQLTFRNDMTDITAKINAIDVIVRRIIGLSQENYKLFGTTYTNGLLTSGAIKIYPTASDLNSDTNALAQYSIAATYNADNTLATYKVIKVA